MHRSSNFRTSWLLKKAYFATFGVGITCYYVNLKITVPILVLKDVLAQAGLQQNMGTIICSTLCKTRPHDVINVH